MGSTDSFGGTYEYRGLKAATWDLFRGDTSQWPDRDFYLDLIRERGEPVLDVGCGTGRLLLDYLGLGIDIDGVDNSPEMLDICRRKAADRGLDVTLYLRDMDRLALERRYQTILVPSSSFQLLTDRATARTALQQLRSALGPRGTLVLPFMVLCRNAREAEGNRDEWKLSNEAFDPSDGRTYRLWSRQWWDLEEKLEYLDNSYEAVRDGVVEKSEIHEAHPATRWYGQEEVIRLLLTAGFKSVLLMSGFTRTPAKPDDDLFCAVACG